MSPILTRSQTTSTPPQPTVRCNLKSSRPRQVPKDRPPPRRGQTASSRGLHAEKVCSSCGPWPHGRPRRHLSAGKLRMARPPLRSRAREHLSRPEDRQRSRVFDYVGKNPMTIPPQVLADSGHAPATARSLGSRLRTTHGINHPDDEDGWMVRELPGRLTEVRGCVCVPCWDGNAAEIRRCKDYDCPAWAFRMGRNPHNPGAGSNRLHARGSSMDGPVIPISAFEPRSRVRLTRTNTTALMSKEFPPIKWVVPDYVPEGLSVLAGRQKLGKTWLQWTWPSRLHQADKPWALSHASKGMCST